ncbi:MAG: cupin domain-containing protein [Bacteroidales bacterium]|nr:cupin domain-containing protein [Bacteroidales bacterium]
MEIRTYKNQEIKDTPHKVDVRQLYDKDSAQAIHIKLKKGESLKPHKTPVDVFFYVLEGLPTIHIGDEHIQCEKDSIIESPADIVHWLSNENNKDARILVVKAPKPIKASKFL